MNFLLSISLVTHLTQLRSISSFLVMLKWKRGSLLWGGQAGKGEERRGGGAGGAWAELPRCSIPGTNSSQTGGNGRWVEKGKQQDNCWVSLAGTSSVVFICFCTQPEGKCDIKKTRQENLHISMHLCLLSEECLLLVPPLPIAFSSKWGGLEN